MAGFLSRLLGRTTPGTIPDADDYFQGLKNWTPVDSSNLHSVAYLPQSDVTGELRVRFKDKKTGRAKSEYSYENVPPSVFDSLMAAHSHGEFFSHNLRYNPAYPYKEIWSFKAF